MAKEIGNHFKSELQSLSRDLNTGPADYKSAALPTKPLRRHSILTFDGKKDGARRPCFPTSARQDKKSPA
jgi:hypothetical protein